MANSTNWRTPQRDRCKYYLQTREVQSVGVEEKLVPRKVERSYTRFPESWRPITSDGEGPFTSKVVHRLPNGFIHIWESRLHRKGRGSRLFQPTPRNRAQPLSFPLRKNPWLHFWAPQRITWWVAVTFLVGSALFTLAAAASLFPGAFGQKAITSAITDWSYFIGAILFTIGTYLEILEAINAKEYVVLTVEDMPEEGFKWWAWQPAQIGFLSSFILLIGSLFFNIETTFALVGVKGGLKEDILVGLPSFLGAILFVISCYMGFMEVTHQYWAWKPRRIDWWVEMFNLLGSVGFLVGAAFGFSVPGLSSPEDELIVKISYFQGSAFFLIGSYLMLPEMFSELKVRSK